MKLGATLTTLTKVAQAQCVSEAKMLTKYPVRQAFSSLKRYYSESSALKFVNLTSDEKTGISTLSLNRPPVNGLNYDLLLDISTAIDSLEKSKCRGMMLTSDNPSVFSAGLDILEMYKPKPERITEFWKTLQNAWLKLYTSSFPTVAVINGHSPAGGCLLALSCEYRIIVGPKFTIGLNETKLGIIAPRWFQDSMRNVIGERQAEIALTTGKMFSADEAFKVGLVDEVATSKEDAVSKAQVFLSQFAKIPAIPRKMTKLGFREDTANWLIKNKELDLQIFLNYINQPKVQEGLGMYLESLKKK